MTVITEAAQVIRQLANDIKECSTNAAGEWDDDEDKEEYRYLIGLAQRLEHTQ